MIRDKSLDEYIEWVKQALFEDEDMRASVEFDEEFMGDTLIFVDPLEGEIKKLYNDLINDRYEFSSESLSFMQIVEKNDLTLLSFKFLLQRINETHTKGLDV